MQKRGAIELPINILVIIIISLVIFAGGIALLYQLTAGAESAKAALDAKTEGELRRLLEIESKKVALPLHTVYLNPGEFHYFGLGILNVGEVKDFYIEVELSKALDEEENDITANAKQTMEEDNWLLVMSGPYSIKQNEYELVPIGVEVPKGTLKGTYIFDVKVYDDPTKDSEHQYDNTKKFYVIVK